MLEECLAYSSRIIQKWKAIRMLWHAIREKFKIFFHKMLEQGVYLAPSAFEAGFMSLAHNDADIDLHNRSRYCFSQH